MCRDSRVEIASSCRAELTGKLLNHSRKLPRVFFRQIWKVFCWIFSLAISSSTSSAKRAMNSRHRWNSNGSVKETVYYIWEANIVVSSFTFATTFPIVRKSGAKRKHSSGDFRQNCCGKMFAKLYSGRFRFRGSMEIIRGLKRPK